MRLLITSAAIACLCFSVSSVDAQSVDITVSSASATGDLGESGNTTLSGTFTENFTANSLTWSGTLNSAPNAFFFEEDVFASVQGANGIGYSGEVAGQQGIFLGATPFSGWYADFTPASVNGDWNFEAYTGNAAISNSTNWTIENSIFSFNETFFPTAESIGVGESVSASLTEGQLLWFEFNHSGGRIQFSTAGSTLSELEGNIADSNEFLAVYDSSGSLIDSLDQDDAILTFTDLAAGDYRIVAAGGTSGTRVGERFIATSHDGEGTIRLAVSVPEPSSLIALWGIGSIFLCLRRRS